MPTNINTSNKIQKLITKTLIAIALMSTIAAASSQAQPVPIGIMPRTPGVGSLGTYPGYKGSNAQRSNSDYLAAVCYRFGSQYGRVIRAIPYNNGNITCDMERASFVVTSQQRFGYSR